METNELEQFSKDLDDVFDEKKSKKNTKVAKPIKEKKELFDMNDPTIKEAFRLKDEQDNKTKLKVLSWVAFTISFVGIILNAWKNIICWPVWIFANIFWIYWAVKKKEWAQVFLWVTFTIANFYGWYMWFIN